MRQAISNGFLTGNLRLQVLAFHRQGIGFHAYWGIGLQARDTNIDILRGLAALLVVVAHYNQMLLSGSFGMTYLGFIGVKIFFIVSGFLIPASFAACRARNATITFALQDYTRKRLWRILPAYYVNLFAMLLLVYMFQRDYFGSATFFHQLWQHLTLTVYFFTWHQMPGFGFNGPYWTLCVEWLWYVLVPALLLFFFAHFRCALILMAMAVAWFLAVDLGGFDRAIAAMETHAMHPVPRDFAERWFANQLPGQLLLFGFGMALWALRGKFTAALPLPRALAILVATGVTLALSDLTLSGTLMQNLVCGMVAAFAFLLVWLAPHRNDPLSRSIRGLGIISYSLYLWHYPLLVLLQRYRGDAEMEPYAFAMLPLFIATLLGISFLSYRFVEAPGIRLAHRARSGHTSTRLTS